MTTEIYLTNGGGCLKRTFDSKVHLLKFIDTILEKGVFEVGPDVTTYYPPHRIDYIIYR